MVAPERWLGGQRIDELEARCGAEGQPNGDSAVQLDHWRGSNLCQLRVEFRDAPPVCLLGAQGASVAGGNGGLQYVGTARAAELLSPLQRSQPAADQELIPARAVLVEEKDGFSGRAGARTRTGRLNLHQCRQAMHLGLLRHQLR